MIRARPAALLITPAFFGYERDIAAELERQGFATTLLDERPSNSVLARALFRVRKDLVKVGIDRYFRAWQGRLAQVTFELVIVVKAEVVPRWFLEDLREKNPGAVFVFYTYDALCNAGNCLQLLDCFDRCYSFDRSDVAAYPVFSYLPLFYTPEFQPAAPGGPKRDLALTFIGTLHSERYRFARTLMPPGRSTYSFFYVQARWYFALTKYVTGEHRKVPWTDVSFTPMARDEIAAVFRRSRAVLDLQRTGQSGLTMRTFEVLASGAILVTTNPAVLEEPFYDPARVVVVSSDVTPTTGDRLWATLDRLDPFEGIPLAFSRFSLEMWVRQVVGERVGRISDAQPQAVGSAGAWGVWTDAEATEKG